MSSLYVTELLAPYLVFLTAAGGTLLFVILCVVLTLATKGAPPLLLEKLVESILTMAQIGFGAVVGHLEVKSCRERREPKAHAYEAQLFQPSNASRRITHRSSGRNAFGLGVVPFRLRPRCAAELKRWAAGRVALTDYT
jgi:hypothetical protein